MVAAATDGCPVSLFLCARQAPLLPRIADGMAFAQAGSFQFNAVSAVDDVPMSTKPGQLQSALPFGLHREGWKGLPVHAIHQPSSPGEGLLAQLACPH